MAISMAIRPAPRRVGVLVPGQRGAAQHEPAGQPALALETSWGQHILLAHHPDSQPRAPCSHIEDDMLCGRASADRDCREDKKRRTRVQIYMCARVRHRGSIAFFFGITHLHTSDPHIQPQRCTRTLTCFQLLLIYIHRPSGEKRWPQPPSASPAARTSCKLTCRARALLALRELRRMLQVRVLPQVRALLQLYSLLDRLLYLGFGIGGGVKLCSRKRARLRRRTNARRRLSTSVHRRPVLASLVSVH